MRTNIRDQPILQEKVEGMRMMMKMITLALPDPRKLTSSTKSLIKEDQSNTLFKANRECSI